MLSTAHLPFRPYLLAGHLMRLANTLVHATVAFHARLGTPTVVRFGHFCCCRLDLCWISVQVLFLGGSICGRV